MSELKITDAMIQSALDATVCAGENVFWSIVFGLRSDSSYVREIMVKEIIRTALEAAYNCKPEPGQPAAVPIDMVLYCPECGVQHIDAAEPHPRSHSPGSSHAEFWTNPPHRSHLCHACGCIWRPADMATNGVSAIRTNGTADTWHGLSAQPAAGQSEPVARINAHDQLEAMANYFVDINELWEGPDGCGTHGTELCFKISRSLESLAHTQMALGLTEIPPFAHPIPAALSEPVAEHVATIHRPYDNSGFNVEWLKAKMPDGTKLYTQPQRSAEQKSQLFHVTPAEGEERENSRGDAI